jgi:hypothetical protein
MGRGGCQSGTIALAEGPMVTVRDSLLMELPEP